MKIRRVWILLKNEILHGNRDILLVMAVGVPVLLALFINLAFGSIFTERTRIGIYDRGNSKLAAVLQAEPSLLLKTYQNESDLKAATARGAVDAGFILEPDFDSKLTAGKVELRIYQWGESEAKNRTLAPVLLISAIRQISNPVMPVEINMVSTGEAETTPWRDRLLPLTVLVAVFFGGLMIPASSIIKEKINHTLESISLTPLSALEIYASKGLLGFLVASIMGVLTLFLSGSYNSDSNLTILFLLLGAVMAAELGLLVGAVIKDINTLYAFWKFGGLLLFGPAIIYLFPRIPEWIAYFFPTFYIIKPVVDISLNNAGFRDVAVYLVVLIGLIALLLPAVMKVIQRPAKRLKAAFPAN